MVRYHFLRAPEVMLGSSAFCLSWATFTKEHDIVDVTCHTTLELAPQTTLMRWGRRSTTSRCSSPRPQSFT
eukprot:7296734-Prymnesium_polylepis.1